MAPFGPVPAMVGNDTSLSAPVSRRKVSSASTASISVSAPVGASRSIQARNAPAPPRRADARCGVPSISVGFLQALSSAHRIAAAHHLAAGAIDQPAQRVGGGGAVERDRGAALRQRGELRRQRIGLGDIGGLFEMVARAVGEFAVIDEHGRAAILRHQRIGQGQRRMRDVGAADIESPGHRVRIRQHQRIDAEPVDLAGIRLSFRPPPRRKTACRESATGPSGGAGRSVHTESSGLLSTATSSAPALAQAAASRSAAAEVCSHGSIRGDRRRQDARSASFRGRGRSAVRPPGPEIDLFGGLQRIAAIDEHRGFLGQHDGEAADPVKPVSQAKRSSEGATYSFCC